MIPESVTSEEARAIAEKTYIFAYPMLENYKTMYNQAIDKESNTYRTPLNHFNHARELLGADFTEVVSPNNDTLYSMSWLDLRTEPIVFNVPIVPDNRYYSFQLVDAFTFDWAYMGTRTTGSNGGTYIIAGPDWAGQKPEGIDEVFQADSEFVFLLGRTAVNGEEDLPNVRMLQDQYTLAPLSAYLGKPEPTPAPKLDFPAWDDNKKTSADFISYLNFLLTTVNLYQKARALIKKSAAIGVEAGQPFDANKMEPAIREGVATGVADGIEKIKAKAISIAKPINGWNLLTDAFGSREKMEDKDLTRAAAAMIGLYGNITAEAYYPLGTMDANGQPLDASTHDYVLRLEKDRIPPVDSFWSFTLYKFPEKLFADNPIDRYSIGDRTNGLKYEEDGSLVIYISHESPGEDRESNWLPAPDGPFYLICRLYLPKPEALADPPYAPPPLNAMEKGAVSKAA